MELGMLCLQVPHPILLVEDKTDIQSEGVWSFNSKLAQEHFGIDSLLYFFLSKMRVLPFTFQENCEDKFTKGFRCSENLMEEKKPRKKKKKKISETNLLGHT